MKKIRKLLASFLCLVMCIGLLPTWALAEGATPVEEPAAEMMQEEIQEIPETEQASEPEVPAEELPIYEEPAPEEAVVEVLPEPTEEVWPEETPNVEQSVATEEPEALPEADVVETEAGIAVADTEVGEPATETDIQESAEPIEEKDAIPVVVAFVVTPEEAELLVYIKDENDEKTEIDPEEDGSYLLLPGEYYYTLTADGYVSVEEESFTVEPSEESVEVELALVPVETIVETESTEEASLQAATEAEESATLMASSGSCGRNLSWTLDDQGTLTISGSGAMNDYFLEYSPWYGSTAVKKIVINYGATSIGQWAFYDCSNVTSVTMPSSLKTIGWDAFYGCSSLTDVTFPNSMESIGTGAFSHCSSLSKVKIPNGITSIGTSTFSGCTNLTEVTIPKSITTIESYAFDGCHKFLYLTIPNSIRTIEEYAFRNCTGFSTLSIPKNVTNVGNNAFAGCSGLTKVIISGMPTMGEGVFSRCRNLKTAGPIGSGCNIEMLFGDYIPENTLNGCNFLESVTIPTVVYSIGEAAFYGCNALKTVFYDGEEQDWQMIAIGDRNDPLLNAQIRYNSLAFGVCGDKMTWDLKKNGTLVIEGSGEMYQYSADNPAPWQDYITNISSVEIKEGAVSIGSRAFYGCSNLKNVTLPSSLRTIGKQALASTGLESFTMPDTIYTLGESVFYNCKSLQTVTLSKNLQEIPVMLFGSCSSLSNVYIPENISTIRGHAFSMCTALKSIALPKSLTAIENYAFYWTGLKTISLPDSVQTLGDAAFNNCESLQTAVLSKNLQEIPFRAFAVCPLLSSVTIPEGISKIGEQAFQRCTSLRSITLPQSLASIEKGAFSGSGLTSITLPDSVQTLGEGVFLSCESLQTVTLSENLTEILNQTFAGCSLLSNIAVPDGIEYIGEQAFTMCTSLKSITLPRKLTSIETGTFFQSGLTTITIPDGVLQLKNGAFKACSKLSTIRIPASVVTIEDDVFYGCTSLEVIRFLGSPPVIGGTSFKDVTARAYYPAGYGWYEEKRLNYGGTLTWYSFAMIRLEQNELTIRPNSSEELKAILSGGATMDDVSWTSSDPTVATVSQKGVVTGKAVGTAEITAMLTDSNVSASCIVTVTNSDILATAVQLNKTNTSIEKGQSETLSATVLPANATYKTVSWRSSNTAVATVSSNGTVTAKAVGTATITATQAESNVSASCVVSVIIIPATAVQLNRTDMSIVKGRSGTLSATVLPTNATYKTVSWRSSNTAVATVSSNGTVTAKAEGTATITATQAESKVSASCVVTVVNIPATSVKLDRTNITIEEGASTLLMATVFPENATNTKISWSSSDPAVAMVSGGGMVTGMAAGTATITAAQIESNVYASCVVTVISIPATAVQLNKTNMAIETGKTDVLRATVLPEDATNKRVGWSSSNKSVAAVSGDGTVTAKAVGTAVITASTVNGKKASCTYRVLFSDVANLSDYFYEPVYWAVDNGITSGTSATTFSPYNSCTRGQVMSFLWKANGSPIVGGSNPFTDVKESDYFYNAVLWAVSQGITSGTSATTFSPYNPCTRAQVMSFLYKAMGSPEVSSSNPFTDVKESDYFYAPVLWAVSQGITNGTSATTFGPYNTCTRAQVMTFLYKAMN